jgi:hypothetical protein
MADKPVLKAALHALATIDAIYQWVDRVDAAGGATSLSGIAACNAMLKSLRQNRPRIEADIIAPLRKAMKDG